MGLKIAPNTYQRKMSETLEAIEGVLIWMDGILIHKINKKNHDIVLKKVINVKKQFRIWLNKEVILPMR